MQLDVYINGSGCSDRALVQSMEIIKDSTQSISTAKIVFLSARNGRAARYNAARYNQDYYAFQPQQWDSVIVRQGDLNTQFQGFITQIERNAQSGEPIFYCMCSDLGVLLNTQIITQTWTNQSDHNIIMAACSGVSGIILLDNNIATIVSNLATFAVKDITLRALLETLCKLTGGEWRVSSNGFLYYYSLGNAPASTGGPVSDDFYGYELNGRWSFINPAGDCSYTMDGTNLLLTVPSGSVHDSWPGNKNGPRIVQNVADVDFTIDARFDTRPSQDAQFTGIHVEQDATNWIRLDVIYPPASGTNVRLFCTSVAGNIPTVRHDATILVGSTFRLRVTRAGDVWSVGYAPDADAGDFAMVASFTQAYVVSKVGVFAGNYNATPASAPAFTSSIDYFFNAASPIIPEDGGSGRMAPWGVSDHPNGINTFAVRMDYVKSDFSAAANHITVLGSLTPGPEVRVTAQDLASQAKYGIRKATVVDRQIPNEAMAQLRANAEIAQRAWPIVSGQFTYSDRYITATPLEIGQTLSIVDGSNALNGSYIIRSIRMKQVNEDTTQYTVTFGQSIPDLELILRRAIQAAQPLP